MLSVRKGGHKDLERYYTLIEMDYDSEELLGRLNIHKAMIDGEQELNIIYDDESNIDQAYALVCTRNLYGYVLLKYFAVLPWCRGRGVGTESMRLLNERYCDRQGMIAELRESEEEKNGRLSKQKNFLKRFGFKEIESNYRIGGKKAQIFVKPMKSNADILPAAHRIIYDFYSRCLPYPAMKRMIDIKPVQK